MSGHKGKEKKVHQKSYAHNPPSKCLVQRAGGDYQNIKGFNPCHYLPTPNEKFWLNEILNYLIPHIMFHHSEACKLFDSNRSAPERTKLRLYTIKGMLDSVVNDVEHFVIMMACPLVDPTTLQVDANNTHSLWKLFHNEAFSVILNLPAFHSAAFKSLESSILSKMQQQNQFLTTLTNESRCALVNFCNEHVARPVYQNQLEHQTVMLHLQQNCAIQSRKIEELKTLMLNGHSARGLPTVTPDRRLLAANSIIDNESIHLSTPTLNATLADGRSPRKRRVPITQLEAISDAYKMQEEEAGCVTQSIESLCDRGLYTLEDYWNMYTSKWRPLEIETEGAWRKDFTYDSDGKKRRQRSSWWTQRVGMFKVVEHYMSEGGLSEEAALAKARTIYNGAKKDSLEKKPGIKALNVAFKKEMDALGIKSTGRPKKQSTNKHPYRKRRKRQPTSNTDDFLIEFGRNDQLDNELIGDYDAQNGGADMNDDDSAQCFLGYFDSPVRGSQTNDDSNYYRLPSDTDTRDRNEAHLDLHGRQFTTDNLYNLYSNIL